MPYVMPARPPLDATAPGPETTLPALRGLGKLAELLPIIATDTREREPLKFTRLPSVKRIIMRPQLLLLRARFLGCQTGRSGRQCDSALKGCWPLRQP